MCRPLRVTCRPCALTEVSPPDRFPQVFYRRDPVDTRLEVDRRDLSYIASSRMFITNGTSLCASPSRESTYRALERAREAGCRVVLDVDYRAMSWAGPEEAGLAVRLALPFVDVLIGNELELTLVAGASSLDEAVEAAQGTGTDAGLEVGRQGYSRVDGNDSVFLRRTQWKWFPPSARATDSPRAFCTALPKDCRLPSVCITVTPRRPSWSAA